MIEKIMKLLGYIKIDKIKISKSFKYPKIEKLKKKTRFFVLTGSFFDKVIVNNENELLDGYTALIINHWIGKKYIKVEKLDCSLILYKELFK